jgi:hypothetical protein
MVVEVVEDDMVPNLTVYGSNVVTVSAWTSVRLPPGGGGLGKEPPLVPLGNHSKSPHPESAATMMHIMIKAVFLIVQSLSSVVFRNLLTRKL